MGFPPEVPSPTSILATFFLLFIVYALIVLIGLFFVWEKDEAYMEHSFDAHNAYSEYQVDSVMNEALKQKAKSVTFRFK